MIIRGDCLVELKKMETNSVDAIITDPPYELGFMGKKWDNSGIANNVEMWKECFRVLKHGGHLLSFGGTRTYQRMAVAIEDAGFEVRDMIEWVYGSGFPKSLNIGKAVDKLQGNEREEIEGGQVASTLGSNTMDGGKANPDYKYTKGTSEYEGWGTALKPSHEPICMARKPLAEKTVAENCLKWGTGGINIDESRVWTEDNIKSRTHADIRGGNLMNHKGNKEELGSFEQNTLGRFPANLIHDNSEEVRECFPETGASKRCLMKGGKQDTIAYGDYGEIETIRGHDDNGGNASRFFKSIIYQSKASKSERNKGCEELEEKHTKGSIGLNTVGGTPTNYSDCRVNKNYHPTVKPIKLMEYLIKMVTPKGGIVLDPFAGSGTTLVACKMNGFKFIGIEMTEEYIPIIEARLNAVVEVQEDLKQRSEIE